jgi:hypothetical protein
MTTNKPERPRNIANDILDAVQSATSTWTRQKKSEERHPGMVRYRYSRMTKQPTIKLKAAWWEIAVEVYARVSGPRNLPALARQIYYQARPKIMAMTEDKELEYGYFSQTLLPNYIEEHPKETKDWNVVYDARGHFEEPHTNRRIGCGTLEVHNYLQAIKEPSIVAAGFSDANVDIIGPAGGFSGVMYCEKEGFNPLFRAVKLANRYDLMLISNKGLSVTAARQLIDSVCGNNDIPLFALHDFDFDGFKILGTLQRDTRRFQFANTVEVIDLGLRLDDIAGLEREPAARTKMTEATRRKHLAKNGATPAEIEILLRERVELNAMTSGALVEMIERKLTAYGLKKVIPDNDVLAEAYQEFHRSNQLRERFEEIENEFDETEIKIPKNLSERVRAILAKHSHLRWDDAIKIVLDKTQLDRVVEEKEKAKKKSGDFTDTVDDDEPS